MDHSGTKNGVHAFRYNSAESKRIWMKSGAHSWGLALVDFGCDLRSSDSLRGSKILLFFGQVNNARFHVGKIWTEQRRSVRCWKRSEQNFENFNVRDHFAEKKRKNYSKYFHFPGLATSSRHNSSMVTYRLKLTIKIALYRMSSFHFYRSFFAGMGLAYSGPQRWD